METGSFTAAADKLGMTSGQASKLVSRLESALGVRLLNRTTRAVSPTKAGQARSSFSKASGLPAFWPMWSSPPNFWAGSD
nr:LysR family transcriptional regulator [Roseinatronobacter thiooxidans]